MEVRESLSFTDLNHSVEVSREFETSIKQEHAIEVEKSVEVIVVGHEAAPIEHVPVEAEVPLEVHVPHETVQTEFIEVSGQNTTELVIEQVAAPNPPVE